MLRNKSLQLILLVSIIIAIAFPLVSITIIYPSFTDMLVRDTEQEAASTGDHLAETLAGGPGSLMPQSITPAFHTEADSLLRNFAILKIKVYTTSGEVIYSSHADEIGSMHPNPSFLDYVSKGRPWSQGIKKDTLSLEGKRVSADVIEIYIPVIHGGRVSGALEIYYDVTKRNAKLNRTVMISSLIPLSMMLLFLIAIVIILSHAYQEKDAYAAPDMSGRYRSPFYSMAIIAASLFGAEILVMFFLYRIPSLPDKLLEAVLAAVLMVMLISPTIYFFFVQPLLILIRKHNRIEKDLEQSRKDISLKHETLQNAFRQVEVAKIEWERTMDCIGDIIILTDRAGRVQRYNSRLAKISGNAAADFRGRPWEDLAADLGLDMQSCYGKNIHVEQKAAGRTFELNSSSFYHSDLNLCGNVITIHEKTTPLP